MKPRTRIPRISKKKQAALDAAGKRAWSTVTPKVGADKKPLPRRAPIAKANPERQKKAAKRGAAKHKAYMTSPTRRAVDARANDRCEIAIRWEVVEGGFPVQVAVRDNWEWVTDVRFARCGETEKLEHHHKRYARYGGNELPTDILVACKPHHAYLESIKPAGNRRSRSRS